MANTRRCRPARSGGSLGQVHSRKQLRKLRLLHLLIVDGDTEQSTTLRVTLLGAVAELDRPPSGISFEEFAEFDDGSRVTWSDDRGCGMSFNEHRRINGRDVMRLAMLVLDVDLPNTYPDVALYNLRQIGIQADPLTAYCAPFRIEFGPRLRATLPKLIKDDWDQLPPAGIRLWGHWRRDSDGLSVVESLKPGHTQTSHKLRTRPPSARSSSSAVETVDPNWPSR